MNSSSAMREPSDRLSLIYVGVSKIYRGYLAIIAIALLILVPIMVFAPGSTSIMVLVKNVAFFQFLGLLIMLPVMYRYIYKGFASLAVADKRTYGIGKIGALGLLAINTMAIGEYLYIMVATSLKSLTLLLMIMISFVLGFTLNLLTMIALYRLGNEFIIDELKLGVIGLIIATLLIVIPNLVTIYIGDIMGILSMAGILHGLNNVRKIIRDRWRNL
ncbi:hypothetical protein [Vulcanisaeta moutnovskia]|nr:hypothetical protein [Vulcanisaeta moutnovskia]